MPSPSAMALLGPSAEPLTLLTQILDTCNMNSLKVRFYIESRPYLNGLLALFVDVTQPELTVIIGTPGPQFHFHDVAFEFLSSKVTFNYVYHF